MGSVEGELVAVGAVYMDFNAVIPEDTESSGGTNKERVGGDYEVIPGGSAVNFARLCVNLGMPVRLIGKIGKDPIGVVVEDAIERSGITSSLVQSPDVQTNVSTHFISKGSAAMTVIGTANASLNHQEVKTELERHIDTIDTLYLGGVYKLKKLLPNFQSLAGYARGQGVQVVLDHGRVNNSVSTEDIATVKDLITEVDIYLPSRDEFLATWDAETIEGAAQKVREKNPDITIVVKDGENGAIGFQGDEIYRVPAFPTDVYHTVGAGDSFNAGFMRSFAERDFLASITFGCATASLKISGHTLPTYEDVVILLDSYSQQKFRPQYLANDFSSEV